MHFGALYRMQMIARFFIYQNVYRPFHNAKDLVTFSFLSTESSTYIFLHVSVFHRTCLTGHLSLTLSVFAAVVMPPVFND